MKHIVILIIAALYLVNAEITPRFPGEQPLIITGTPTGPPAGYDYYDIEDKVVIDDFSLDTIPPVLIILPQGGAPPEVTETSFDQGSGILAGERDIILTAEIGATSLVFSAGASGGVFTIATPNGGSGVAFLQYDGIDSSTQLSISPGLGDFDLTTGDAIGFRILALTDVDTVFFMTVVDSNGNSASVQGDVPGGVQLFSYFVDFETFLSTIDFTRVAAIEFEVEAFANVDFNLENFSTYGPIPTGFVNCFQGAILPCDADYYRIETLTDVQVGDYVKFYYNVTGEAGQPNSGATFYITTSPFDDLQTELETNENIVDTLGGLPGRNNYMYRCDSDCAVEIVWSTLEETNYYLGIEGRGNGIAEYQVCYEYNQVPVFQLLDGVREPIFLDQRADYPPEDRVINYRYYVIDIPPARYSPGSYLVVNISRVEPFPGMTMRLMYESLPEAALDTGVLDDIDFDSEGVQVDNVIWPWCVDIEREEGEPNWVHPVKTDPRMPCECFSESRLIGGGPAFQLTCQLVVDPCRFLYGNWYISVELPARAEPYDPLDTSGRTNYTLFAELVQPVINELERNETVKAFLEPEIVEHFFIDVPANTVVEGETHLMVHISNVRNAFVDVWVHQGLPPDTASGNANKLAGGPESCVPANATCHTCDACNVIIEKCHFVPGEWYISVSVSWSEELGNWEIFDWDRLPVTFTLRAEWVEDAVPELLVAGVPVSKWIGEALYDFYVIEVPPTIDTWLFIELFAKAEDTEVVLSILHGELPGGECYARPDFYCMTGDPYGKRWSTGPPTFYDEEAVQRESCNFMIQTCELEPGPLFLSVYGHHVGYNAYGDNTFYQVPVHYTLWADFDVALALSSGVSYSETVFEHQYQHYYIRADQIEQGSWLSVEITNIRHGIPQTIEAFVNYNYLAGNCPCYDHLYNCTGSAPCSSEHVAGALPHLHPHWDDTTLTCCTIVVPASDFRPGVWYVSVLGVTEDYFQYTTPIGYTLTVTIHDAPEFNPLILGQTWSGEVPQWNRTLEYTHFRLGAQAVPLQDLVIKITFVQNCEFMGKHDDKNDAVWLFVNKGAPATALGFDYWCKADIPGDSYCTVVIPHCEWSGDDYFIAVQGDYKAYFNGRFTLRAFTDEVRDIQLWDGISHYDRVAEGRYKHYFITTTAEEDHYLQIDIYTNSDQDMITAYLNKDTRAGGWPCFENMAWCSTKSFCSWQLLACDLEPGRYYVSVYGLGNQFYDTSVEYTLTATHNPVSTRLQSDEPVTSHLWNVGDVVHYFIEIDEIAEGEYLVFSVDNVKHGAVRVYAQYNYLAGRCPCFIWEDTCYAEGTTCEDELTSEEPDYCDIRIPTCELVPGTIFFSVWAVENLVPDPPVFNTPIGFVAEARIIPTRIVNPTVAVGRFGANFEIDERIANNRYIHYQFRYTTEDWEAGYHVIVEIIYVRDGALFVYYNPLSPPDNDPSCHTAQLCTSGLGSGRECHWQIPFGVVRPLDGENEYHYVSVEARTGRLTAGYSILIFKQAVPSIVANPAFTLFDDDDSFVFTSGNFPPGVELNITHTPRQEPNGWTQFFRLESVAHTDDGRGDLLELFFYRVTQNAGQNMDFDVYVHPLEPAGAHECCEKDPVTYGSCQNAPTLNSADTTTAVNYAHDVVTHTCSFGPGQGGTDFEDDFDEFFGERCIVRVWPCEFHKYCNRTVDWFASVVPRTATDPSTSGPGLQYSVQWRSRNIRNVDDLQITTGTVDLTPFINTYEFEPAIDPYTITNYGPESEGWRSFVVNWELPNSRLSIQTLFGGDADAHGIVYINGDEFASETPTCEDYECFSDSSVDCSGSGRYYVTEACSVFDKSPSQYYITIRNDGATDSVLTVQFRIVSISLPSVIEIPQNPTPFDPYVNGELPSVFPGITGVEGDNYNFYFLTIDDDEIEHHESWVIEVSFDDDDDSTNGETPGSLEVYIRYGVEGGLYDTDNQQAFYGNTIEGAHSWQYACTLPFPGSVCTWQIPSCALIRGHWYISIRNPDFVLNGFLDDLPDYTLLTYVSEPPIPLTLNSASFSSISETVLLEHWAVNVTAADLAFDDRSDFQGYWTRYLRFQFDDILEYNTIDTPGSIEVWINYGELAGGDNYNCLGFFANFVCSNIEGCFWDVNPCEIDGMDMKLITGQYFIAVRQLEPTTYTISASILSNVYTPIALTETVAGTGHRTGTTNELWRWVVTDSELIAAGDGNGNYRYVIDTGDGNDDDLPDNQYFIVNITATGGDVYWDIGDTIRLEVWRDDCTRWECNLDGPDSWCTIDALGLAPCSGKNGRFFFRVENFNADQVPFTLDFYRNETTVQNLWDRQIITEIVYPYEYQEYYYEPVDVGLGATLTVEICGICGEVQAFIRPDLPAGPSPDGSGEWSSCNMDSCEVTGSTETQFSDDNNCCFLFLDTCQYEQRGYYIGIRGVSTVYPGSLNANLYLPAKYEIQAYQTNIDYERVDLNCPEVVTWYEPVQHTPRQYYVDVETVNVGTILRFSMRVPWIAQQMNPGNNVPTLWVNLNSTVPYSDACPSVWQCSGSAGCWFEITACDIMAANQGYDGRWFIWADAPRGTEILVEQWDPVIPIINENQHYWATINGQEENGVLFNTPFTPNQQLYRFDLDPHGDENYYEKFFVRVLIQNVRGSVSARVTSGCDCCEENSLFVGECSARDGEDCWIDIYYSDLLSLSGWNTKDIPWSYWLTIWGNEQTCELHSIPYSFVVQTNWVLTYFPVDTTVCEHIHPNQCNFHRLRPREVEYPQNSYLHITLEDYDGDLSVYMKDGYLATRGYGEESWTTEGQSKLEFDYFCGYDDLYLSVCMDIDQGYEHLDYRLTVEKVKTHVKELFDDSVYYADDDDDDACPHEHDFYVFKTFNPRGHHEGSFFRTLVDSECPTEVFVNKHTFAWKDCHDGGYGTNDPASSGTTSVNVYDFCDYTDGLYYITVVADCEYYIYTDVRDDAIPINIGEVYRDTLEPGMYQVYTLEICKDWFEADDRLVVEITDVENGSVEGWIRRDAVPGIRTTMDGSSSCASDWTRADYLPGNSGYDFLLVNHVELTAGTYQILIRAGHYTEGTSPPIDRNCEDISFRLFPYLIDYHIEPEEISPNVIVSDAVDMYTINRMDPGSLSYANYYVVHPLMEDEGYYEQVSQAVARLMNVEGGLLYLRVLCGHLATSEWGFIPGEIQALTKTGLIDPVDIIQYGHHPWNWQRILDPRTSKYQPECTGAADWCGIMGFDDLDIYQRDNSVAVWLSSCYFIWDDFYLAVEPIEQFYEDHPVTYDLLVHHTRDFILLQPNTNRVDSFTDDNWDYHFYYSIAAEPQSMRWRVVVTEGEGVLVTVRDHRCPLQACYVKEMWCDASYYDEGQNWMCEIEIPTRAAHPGEHQNAYFISVYGKNATYSIAFWRGRENCHDFTGNGRNEGLDFCAGLVPYTTWRYETYEHHDHAARCLFEQLYDHFRVQPCWSGVSSECNSTLQAFACYEHFHRCDAQGFQVGTCRDACEAVVYECVNWFESVDLEHYNCTSSRYLDSRAEVCTGGEDFSSWDELHSVFLVDEPNVLLFDSSPDGYQSSASTLSFSFASLLVAIILVLLI